VEKFLFFEFPIVFVVEVVAEIVHREIIAKFS
jgi:hypothetical protein